MKDSGLLLHQSRFEIRAFLRDPAATFYTLVFPVLLLVLFVAIFGNSKLDSGIETSTFYVPGIVALAVVSATFINLAITFTQQRESGLLKRVRGTPLPSWIFIAGRLAVAVAVALAMASLLVVFGRFAYDVTIPGAALVGFVLALIVGSAAFCSLAAAVTAAVPSEAAAPAAANAITLPLFFISGVFIPAEDLPRWMLSVADFFPVKPFADALLAAFDPATTGLAIAWGDLAVVVGWGLAGAAVAARTFRWAPRGG